MSANLENTAGLEKDSFHSKESLNYRTIVLISYASKVLLKNLQARLQTVREPRTFRCTSWIQKRQRNQRSNYQYPLIIGKAKEFQKNIYFCFIDYAKAFDCVDHNKLWKIVKEMGIPDHLTYFLRNLYAGPEATVRTRHGTMDWFKIEKGVYQDCILSLCLFNLYAEYIMQNPRLDES